MLQITSKSTPIVPNSLQLPQINSKCQISAFLTSQNVSTCPVIVPNFTQIVKTCRQLVPSFQNRLATPHNASNRLTSLYTQHKTIRIVSESLPLASNHQNFIRNFNKLLSIVPLGHRFSTTCPKSPPNFSYASPASLLRLQTSQMSPIIANCPETESN